MAELAAAFKTKDEYVWATFQGPEIPDGEETMPSEGFASIFFQLLNEDWRNIAAARSVRRAILQYHSEKQRAVRLLALQGRAQRFEALVRQLAEQRVTRLLAETNSTMDTLRPRSEVDTVIHRHVLMAPDGHESYLERLNGFLDFSRLAVRAKLIPTAYRTIVQEWRGRGIHDPIAALVLESTRRPKLIYDLTGRQFEHFLAEIFRGFGWDVEVTAETRDKGRDIICLKRIRGNPFRIAIEAKRYAENRPISFSLVTQFIGANRAFDVDRILFVSTSRFTKPALEVARENLDFLTVKQFSDVIEWANRYSQLVPNNRSISRSQH